MSPRKFNRASIPPKGMNFNPPMESPDVESQEPPQEQAMEMQQGIQENNVPQLPMRASRPMRMPKPQQTGRANHYKHGASKNWRASSYKSKASPRPPM